MKDRLIELLSTAPADFDGNRNVSTLADYLLANGVIVPPCKVGDTVYCLDDFVFGSDCEECKSFEAGWHDCPSVCGKTNSTTKHHDCIKIVEETVTYHGLLHYMRFERFGKTVFLTREAAEQALKGGV